VGRWRAKIHFKSDERILGNSDFVDKVLKTADEALERKYQLKTQGYDLIDIGPFQIELS